MFIVHTLPRMGTYFLQSSLNSHPDITCLPEPFLRRAGVDTAFGGKGFKLYLGSLISEHPDQILGFSLHPRQVSDKERSLLASSCDRVVCIRRANLLRWLCSMKVANRTQKWTQYREPKKSAVRFRVDSKQAVSEFREALRELKGAETFWKMRCECMHVDYETLCTSFDESMSKILSFLGAPQHKCKPRTHKQESRKLSEIITNYPQLEKAFRGTRWESFLE